MKRGRNKRGAHAPLDFLDYQIRLASASATKTASMESTSTMEATAAESTVSDHRAVRSRGTVNAHAARYASNRMSD